MKILISNDDGVFAEGIHIIAKKLSEIGEVYVAAPSSEKSGASHGITSDRPLRAKKIDFGDSVVAAWAIDGLPADCVKLAIEELLPCRPDIVVSGINHGANLGTDTVYSGTVAAAMEGYFYRIPSIALSVCGSSRRHDRRGNFEIAAEVGKKFVLELAEQKKLQLLNINVPGNAPDEIKGTKFTCVGWRWYDQAFAKRQDPSGRDYYWLQGTLTDDLDVPETDVLACSQGFISISPLKSDYTDFAALDELKKSISL